MARCRVCHRTLRDAESIALGIGPTCRAKGNRFGIAASQAKTTDETSRREKLARIERILATLCDWEARCDREIARLRAAGRRDQVEIGLRVRAQVWHRMARVEAMRVRLMSAAKRAA